VAILVDASSMPARLPRSYSRCLSRSIEWLLTTAHLVANVTKDGLGTCFASVADQVLPSRVVFNAAPGILTNAHSLNQGSSGGIKGRIITTPGI